MSVGAPTDTASETWEPVRRDGKLLFEVDMARGLIRLRRWGRVFIVDLCRVSGPQLEDERLRQ